MFYTAIPRKGLANNSNKFLVDKGVPNVSMVYQSSIVKKDNELEVDEGKLRKKLMSLPPENKSGLGVLDWEGKAIEILKDINPENKEKKEKVLKQFLKALSIAQEVRPDLKWGYYGIPFREYWNRNDKWRAKNNSLTLLYEKSDALYPSIYDFYENKKSDTDYISQNCRESLRIGKKYGLPSYVFVHHRYHPSNKTKRLDLIPIAEFEEHVSTIMQKYEEGRIKGVIWWNSDRYHINKKTEKIMLQRGEKSIPQYEFEIISTYTNSLENLLKETKER